MQKKGHSAGLNYYSKKRGKENSSSSPSLQLSPSLSSTSPVSSPSDSHYMASHSQDPEFRVILVVVRLVVLPWTQYTLGEHPKNQAILIRWLHGKYTLSSKQPTLKLGTAYSAVCIFNFFFYLSIVGIHIINFRCTTS